MCTAPLSSDSVRYILALFYVYVNIIFRISPLRQIGLEKEKKIDIIYAMLRSVCFLGRMGVMAKKRPLAGRKLRLPF